MTPLEKSRRTGKWPELLDWTMGEGCCTYRLRQQLTGSRCLLLDYAAHAQHQGHLSECANQLKRYPAQGLRREKLGAAAEPYDHRRKLIWLLANSTSDIAGLTMAIQLFINHVAERWHFSAVSAVNDLASARIPFGRDAASGQYREPSFMPLLPHEAWRVLFRQFAESCGWLHPGLLLAGETLAAIYGDTRTVEATVRTSILFAFNHETRPFGIVAPLRVERLRGGCGVLLPNAWSTAYLQMDAQFSTGLQHAWYAIQKAHPQACNFDWRWSIDLNLGTRHLPQPPVTVSISGHSGEAAFACALWAVDKRVKNRPPTGDPLDVHVAITAQFKHPGTDRLDLMPVTSVDGKTLAFPFVKRRISTVVLAKDHDPDDLPPSNHARHDDEHAVGVSATPRFPEVGSLAAAYEELSRGPRITRAVKEKVFKTAAALREKLCGKEVDDPDESGARYVPSPLAELLPHAHHEPDAMTKEQRERRLSAQELTRFAAGRWRSPRELRPVNSSDVPRGPRIRLFADSGLGKSIQLLLCEEQIAESKHLVIPIRLGKTDKDSGNLSAICWNEDPDVILRNILKRTVLKLVPDDDQSHAENWFFSLVDHGKVVFLLDALDQSREALNGFGGFLNSARLQACPVILAGRPETLSSRSEAFEGLSESDWTTLKVLPFGRDEQARFLGRHLAPQLIPEKDELGTYEWDADEIRRHLWKDLLGVPLLLRFLQDLASGESVRSVQRLHDYRNRYEIYRAAIAHLIEKGLSTVAGSPQVLRVKVERLLPKIAFAAVRRHEFTGVVEGEAFLAVFAEIENLYDQLLQVDLVTEHCVLDEVGRNGLEFRHRSMLEYFAGIRLAELFATDSAPESEVVNVLRSVQSVLDEKGAFRADLLNDDQTCRNLPADWQWTLRFALAHAATLDARNALAWQLIRFGNPWVVYEAIDRDGLTFDADLDKVCRWLVHRDCAIRNYRDAWEKSGGPPAVETLVRSWVALITKPWLRGTAAGEAAMEKALQELLSPATRDAAFLHPLLELLEATVDAAETKASFAAVAAVCQSALDGYYGEAATWSRGTSASARSLATLLNREQFVPIPEGTFDPRDFDEPKEYHGEQQLADAGVTGPVTIAAGLQFADFPVTNAEIEAWCPTQRRWRDSRSPEHDHPAVWVSWFMGMEFARWLTSDRRDGCFTLPSEWEWEYACRAGSTTDYWWGAEMREDLCWYDKTSEDGSTRPRYKTLQAEQVAGLPHPWGLHDMHGNVWEWCVSQPRALDHASTAGRVLRGGSWRHYAAYCRSAFRHGRDPDRRDDLIGLRLCWRSRWVESELSSSDGL